MKGVSAPLEKVMLLIATVIGVSFAVVLLLDTGTGILRGECWDNAHKAADEVNNAIEDMQARGSDWDTRKIPVILGSCAAGMAFINFKDIGDVNRFLQSLKVAESQTLDVSGRFTIETCDPGPKAYIVGVPYIPDTLSGWDIRKVPKDALENLGNLVKKFRGITPFCDSLDCATCSFNYKDEPIGISGPGGEGTSKYCLLVTRLSNSYYKIAPEGGDC